MIGVLANPDEHSVVCEFFELFKTPWEFYRSDRHYDVLISATGEIVSLDGAKLVLVYAGHETPFDAAHEIKISSQKRTSNALSYKGIQIPLYGNRVTFREGQSNILADEESRLPAIDLRRSQGKTQGRVGYDLFSEIAALLTAGQPAANAATPALDLHIAFLRDLIIESGVELVEIPPVPDGYRFTVCLTHDVDHPSIRNHKFDHTMMGFLYRAVFGSVFDVFRGRLSVGKLLTNWQAALKLFFVHLGFAKDFWSGFEDYMQLERGLNSTYFVIPFKDNPGRTAKGPAPSPRASRYGAVEIANDIRKLIAVGSEVGLHGIDAWRDSSSGRVELEEIRRLTGKQEIGIRMHWLYFEEQSPQTLERAGLDYDSTVGYNGTVGYRAGTSQVYKPLNASRLLELPLHIMDTALFFPSHLDLSPAEARTRTPAARRADGAKARPGRGARGLGHGGRRETRGGRRET